MVGYALNSGLTKRSRLDTTNSPVLNSADPFFRGSYPTAIDRGRDGVRRSFSSSCWRRFCATFRSSNNNGFFCACYVKEESRPRWFSLFYDFTKSTVWFSLFSGFSVFLMFGPSIQSLIDTGAKGDIAFLNLRIIMFFFFIVDMLVRCITEENYFAFRLCRRKDIQNSASSLSRSNTNNGDSIESFFRFGSFLFWCDFLSNISILYDLSFINNHHFDPVVVEIYLTGGILVRSIAESFNCKYSMECHRSELFTGFNFLSCHFVNSRINKVRMEAS